MKFLGLFKKAKNEEAAPADISHMLKCKVNLVINRSSDQYFWNWNLVSPKYITKLQNAQLDGMVADYCKEAMFVAPEAPDTIKRQMSLKVLP
jgi:hypothetical protein